MAYTYATWNPSDKNASITLSNGNLTATDSSGWFSCRSTISVSKGKWYWEYTVVSGTTQNIYGIANASASLSNLPGGDANGWGYQSVDGQKANNNSASAYGSTFTNGDVIGVALDMDGGTITMYKNGTSQGIMFSSLTGSIFAAVGMRGASVTANFGATAFAQTVPSGFNAGLYTAASVSNVSTFKNISTITI
jgi:hypothetical protein